ncbi:hypothetical protein MycrhDRAFT_5747 [Mycolicibacterium rhodesiae JS60]|nr:hypothetical protein MycrhDRAFT_5747 [Mycolicibacterium rhodesiae JS60]
MRKLIKLWRRVRDWWCEPYDDDNPFMKDSSW